MSLRRTFLSAAAGAACALSGPAVAAGIGGFGTTGGFIGPGFGVGPVGVGGLGAPGGLSSLGIAGRGIGPYGAAPGGFVGGRGRFGFGPRRPGERRGAEGNRGFGFGYGGYGAAAGLLLGGYPTEVGFGYPGDVGPVVVTPRRPEAPVAIGIREAPTQPPAIYVIDKPAVGGRAVPRRSSKRAAAEPAVRVVSGTSIATAR